MDDICLEDMVTEWRVTSGSDKAVCRALGAAGGESPM